MDDDEVPGVEPDPVGPDDDDPEAEGWAVDDGPADAETDPAGPAEADPDCPDPDPCCDEGPAGTVTVTYDVGALVSAALAEGANALCIATPNNAALPTPRTAKEMMTGAMGNRVLS